jgi:hypothetical protein
VIDVSSAHAESRLVAEMLKTSFKVVGSKRQISVELGDEFPVAAAKRVVTLIKSLDNTAARLSKPSV